MDMEFMGAWEGFYLFCFFKVTLTDEAQWGFFCFWFLLPFVFGKFVDFLC
uniref:Uncharacterized protein n=1 Tax=Arcella intermedia TaxID=1963864 RepID=A0A6B2LWP0_9EUKA